MIAGSGVQVPNLPVQQAAKCHSSDCLPDSFEAWFPTSGEGRKRKGPLFGSTVSLGDQIMKK